MSSSEASYLLGINHNTFKTRLARGQALAVRSGEGKSRKTLSFTGHQLVHNLLADRLLQYGLPSDEFAEKFSDWCFENILSKPYRIDAVLRFRKDEDGRVEGLVFEEGDVESWTGDAALIIPIGSMLIKLALNLYTRDMSRMGKISNRKEYITASLEAAIALDYTKEK